LKAKKTHDPSINNALSITNGVSESTQTSIHTIFFYYMHKLADSVQSIYTVSNAYYIMYLETVPWMLREEAKERTRIYKGPSIHHTSGF
jgi:hypothetical protein